MRPVGRVFSGKRVIVTGHTGFKGAWLSEWLLALGAEVFGFSLPPPPQPALFDQLGLAARLHHHSGDIRDAAAVGDFVRAVQPDFVFHLAAQALVRRSYADPLETFTTNVTGTAHVLAALRSLTQPCAVVIVTSDKCYANHEAGRLYREDDALGGRDPYSASKAAAELVTAAWRDSFFPVDKIVAGLVPPVGISTARAGNVIGGGDWALDRIVPDSVRAMQGKKPIPVRNPAAIRPWQHVLEPLGGYLLLAEEIYAALVSRSSGRLGEVCGAFNFGPAPIDHRTVRDLVVEMLQHAPGSWVDASDPAAPHEAKLLHLATDKARAVLGWVPRWGFAPAVAHTLAWYQAPAAEAVAFTQRQIHTFASTPTA
jgi:CDP-glucose 4,6-dehydratase